MKISPQTKKQPIAVAFLVNGFTGCCIPKDVHKFLEDKGADVHVANWNDLHKKRHAGSFTRPDQITYNVDEFFIKQMQDAVKPLWTSVARAGSARLDRRAAEARARERGIVAP